MTTRKLLLSQANQRLAALTFSSSPATAYSVKHWALRRVDATCFAKMTDHQAEMFGSLVEAISELLQEVHHG